MEFMIGWDVAIFCSLIFNVGTVSGSQISEKTFNNTAEDAVPKEFPFMARIESDKFYRNGILISENFVLSTAFSDSNFFSGKTFVVVGDLEYGTTKDDTRVKTYDVIETFVHPNFNAVNQRSDILLLKLNESVKFDEYVRPASLSLDRYSIPKQLLEIGCGKTNVRSDGRLKKIKMNFISNESCKKNRTSHHRKYIQEIDNGAIFCAGPKEGDETFCGGYSGSALINEFNEIVGIASVNFDCKDYHRNLNVFVRVSAYIEWIERYLWAHKSNSTTESTGTTNDVELTTETKFKFSTPTTIKPNRHNTKKPWESKYIIVITIVTILLTFGLLGVSILLFRWMLQSKNRNDPVIVLVDRGSESIWLNSETISIK